MIMDAICKHCVCVITSTDSGNSWVHAEGSYRGKSRCGSESNRPYGLNAAPVGVACQYPCADAPNPFANAEELIDNA